MYLCVFIHGRERIGHAQLAVAAIGVLPASVPLFETDLCFGHIASRRKFFLCATTFNFNHRTVAVSAPMRIGLRISESSQLHWGQSPWHLQTSPSQSDEASSAAYGRTSASLSRWPRPRPFTHRCPRKVFKSRETSANIFFNRPWLTVVFRRTRCDAGPISLDLVINTRSLLPHSSDRDPHTLVEPRQCILTQ